MSWLRRNAPPKEQHISTKVAPSWIIELGIVMFLVLIGLLIIGLIGSESEHSPTPGDLEIVTPFNR